MITTGSCLYCKIREPSALGFPKQKKKENRTTGVLQKPQRPAGSETEKSERLSLIYQKPSRTAGFLKEPGSII
jgi:hypothetical protein